MCLHESWEVTVVVYFPLLCMYQIPLQISGICSKYLGENGKVLAYLQQLFRSIPFCRCYVSLPGAAHGGVFYLQKQKNIAGALAFWMANASELLNFIKQDRDLSRLTLDAQDVLAHLVQMAFK